MMLSLIYQQFLFFMHLFYQYFIELLINKSNCILYKNSVPLYMVLHVLNFIAKDIMHKNLPIRITSCILLFCTTYIASITPKPLQVHEGTYNPIRTGQITTTPQQVRNDENPTCCRNALSWEREAIHPCSGFPDRNDKNPTCCSIIKQGAWSFGYDITHPHLCCRDYIEHLCLDDENESTVIHNNLHVTTVIQHGLLARFYNAQQPLHPITTSCRKITCLCCCFSFITATYGAAVFTGCYGK